MVPNKRLITLDTVCQREEQQRRLKDNFKPLAAICCVWKVVSHLQVWKNGAKPAKKSCSLLEICHVRWQYPQSPAALMLLISGMPVYKLTTHLTTLSVPRDLVYIPGLPGRGLLSGNMLRTSEMYPPKVYRAHFSSWCVYFFTALSTASEL